MTEEEKQRKIKRDLQTFRENCRCIRKWHGKTIQIIRVVECPLHGQRPWPPHVVL